MTDDLISRRDAIDELTKFFCDNDVIRGDFPNCERNERKATVLMENVRSIDAEPVRHGRWVERWVDNKHRIGDMECSVCGAPMLDCPSYSLYCPWCGAKMDLRGKEE